VRVQLAGNLEKPRMNTFTGTRTSGQQVQNEARQFIGAGGVHGAGCLLAAAFIFFNSLSLDCHALAFVCISPHDKPVPSVPSVYFAFPLTQVRHARHAREFSVMVKQIFPGAVLAIFPKRKTAPGRNRLQSAHRRRKEVRTPGSHKFKSTHAGSAGKTSRP
jgi:hypothetical protein